MFRFHKQQQQRYSASGFQEQLRQACYESMYSMNYFIKYALEDQPNKWELEERLMTSQQTIGQLIGHFYGNSNKLAEAFVQFMKYTTEAIEVFRWKKDIVNFRTKWHEATDKFMHNLYELNEWSLRDYFYKQISLTESLIKSLIKGDETAHSHYYNKLISVNRGLADVITGNIIKSNNTLFVQ